MRSFRLDTATGVRVLQLSEVSAHGDRPASHERAISRGACPVARRNDVRKIQGRRTDRARHNPHPHRSRATQPRAVPNRVNASCRGARPEKTRAAQLRVKTRLPGRPASPRPGAGGVGTPFAFGCAATLPRVHSDAGGYASGEPFAKAQHALGVHGTMVNARRSPPARVVVPAICDTRGLRRLRAPAACPRSDLVSEDAARACAICSKHEKVTALLTTGMQHTVASTTSREWVGIRPSPAASRQKLRSARPGRGRTSPIGVATEVLTPFTIARARSGTRGSTGV